MKESTTLQVMFPSGTLAKAVRRLIEHSPIAGKVEFGEIDSMLHGARALMTVTDVTPYFWSTGEELLWDFLTGVAGQGPCPLYEIVMRFRGTALAPWIGAVVNELLSIDPDTGTPGEAAAALMALVAPDPRVVSLATLRRARGAIERL